MNALVRDTVVAGSPGDFMTVRHLVLRGSQRDIGRALAGVAVRDLGVRKAPWTDPDATRAQLAWLERRWPAHHARALGVASALQLPADGRLDPTHLFYDWAVPGCSNVYWPPATSASGRATLTRNYDFTTGTVFELMGRPAPPAARPATSRPFVVETHPDGPDAGHATLVMTAYELLGGATDGVNAAGLAVALMATVDVMRGPGYAPTGKNAVGVSEIQLVRYLLENAATAAEARALLARTPTYTQFVPCHYLVADAGGDAFLWSRIAQGEVSLEDAAHPGRPLCATNHLPGRTVADIPQRAESVERLDHLREAAAAALVEGPASTSAIDAVARSVAATLPPGEGQYAAQSPARTLWHGRYDLAAPALDVDYYLGEADGGHVRRSRPLRFAL